MHKKEKKKKKKKVHCSLYRFPLSTCMDVLVCFIEYVLYRVHMRASFWDSILVYILGESMSRSFNFCERDERPFFRIFGSLPYLSLHSFLCDLSPCFDAGWPSLTFLSFCLLPSLFYSSISLYLIWFLYFFIMLDVWLGFSIHTLFLLIRYVHSVIITFRVGVLRFVTHDVLYALHLMHEGYEYYIIGIIEPSFLSFLSP